MKHAFPPDTPYDNHDDELTLTERKEKALAAQELGRQIVNLSARQLRYVPLEGDLLAAIVEARRLTHRGSITRQLQFIGKIMRTVDHAPLLQGLEDARSPKAFVTPREASVQQWTQRLAQGQGAIGDFLLVAPEADRTRLSQLIRQHAKNVEQNKASNAALSAYVDAELKIWDEG